MAGFENGSSWVNPPARCCASALASRTLNETAGPSQVRCSRHAETLVTVRLSRVARSSEAKTQEQLLRLCPLFAERAQEGGKQKGPDGRADMQYRRKWTPSGQNLKRPSCCVSRGKAGENASADSAANQNFWRIEELLYSKRNSMHFGINIGKLS